MNIVNEENWGHSSFKSSQLQALITLGAHPLPNSAPQIVYFVTLLDQDNQEVFQQEFELLLDALEFINKRYGHWEFLDREKGSSVGGCGTCAAH